MNTQNNKKTKRKTSKLAILIIILCVCVFGYVLGFLIYTIKFDPKFKYTSKCAVNLTILGKALHAYAVDNDSKYPPHGKWCDILLESTEFLSINQLHCPDADGQLPSYAINPNCKPNSPNDVVLLFESKGGWNLYGGKEIANVENHYDNGCFILRNDGHVHLDTLEELSELNWGIEKDSRDTNEQ